MDHFTCFDLYQFDGFTELKLRDSASFELSQYAEFQQELWAVVEMYRPVRIVVNFEQVSYCSTALVSGLLNAQRRLRKMGGELKLCNMIEPVRNVFRVLQLDGPVLEIHDSESKALASF